MNRQVMEKTRFEKRRVDVVLFDFGGVLAEEGWKNGFTAIAAASGLDGEGLVSAATDAVYASGYITGKGTRSDFWRLLREKTGLQGEADLLWREIFARFVLRAPMMGWVKKLKAEGLVVGILSDQIDMLDALDARDNFFSEFDHVFNSYHLGKGKRDASLFDDLAGFLKTEPGRILFIDDAPGNVERARQKGWNAILYRNAETFDSDMAEFFGTAPPAVAGKGDCS
ncbi:MAG: HAD family phosphatase [Deltaproteobacteria bacterium]|nr:HAD family phosphatase [Deltaproteobacteria bacterium]